MAGMLNGSPPDSPFVTRQEVGSMLDDFARRQSLRQEPAAPNTNIYQPVYNQQAAAPQQNSTQSSQTLSSYNPSPNYGFRPYMGVYGMQSPFSQFGGYGGVYGYGGMGGFGGYMNSYSPFGGGYGYGQMYNPFSMY